MPVRPYWSWGARTRWGHRNPAHHAALIELFTATGDLYGPAHDASESAAIRESCEAAGVPMGYGRVHETPAQLTWSAARAQWRTVRER